MIARRLISLSLVFGSVSCGLRISRTALLTGSDDPVRFPPLMAFGAKILTFTAILCILLWVTFLALGAQPLKETGSLTIIYGENEDFYADAAAYRKVRNETLFLIHLPRARPDHRWWAVDFKNMTISSIGAPSSVGSRKYLLRGDQEGTVIGNKDNKEGWFWHFTEGGAAFAGNGFTCSVRKDKSN